MDICWNAFLPTLFGFFWIACLYSIGMGWPISPGMDFELAGHRVLTPSDYYIFSAWGIAPYHFMPDYVIVAWKLWAGVAMNWIDILTIVCFEVDAWAYMFVTEPLLYLYVVMMELTENSTVVAAVEIVGYTYFFLSIGLFLNLLLSLFLKSNHPIVQQIREHPHFIPGVIILVTGILEACTVIILCSYASDVLYLYLTALASHYKMTWLILKYIFVVLSCVAAGALMQLVHWFLTSEEPRIQKVRKPVLTVGITGLLEACVVLAICTYSFNELYLDVEMLILLNWSIMRFVFAILISIGAATVVYFLNFFVTSTDPTIQQIRTSPNFYWLLIGGFVGCLEAYIVVLVCT